MPDRRRTPLERERLAAICWSLCLVAGVATWILLGYAVVRSLAR